MSNLTSFCTYWNFDASEASTKEVRIPIDPCTLRDKRLLHSRVTAVGQQVEIYQDFFGNKQLYINHKYQVGLNHSNVEPYFGDDSHQIYIDALKFHGLNPGSCKILIIGGGDLGLAGLLLEHGATDITQFELDKEVVEVCKEYIPAITSPALLSDKVSIQYCDGFQAISKLPQNTFDVIIGDLTAEGAELFNDPRNLKAVKAACSDQGIVITHFAEGGIDLNAIHFHFNQKEDPNFACIIELSYDENCIWSPKPLKLKKNIPLAKLENPDTMKQEIKAFFTGLRDRKERETKKIYSNEKVFNINGEDVTASLTIDIYQEMEYKINNSCDFSDLPTSDPAELSKILHWIMDGQNFAETAKPPTDTKITTAPAFSKFREGSPHVKNFYPNAWAAPHNEDGNGARREKVLHSFFEMECTEHDNDRIYHYGGNVDFIKTMYDISPNT